MDESNDDERSCSMCESDDEGHPNLCCCYIIDADDNIDDPCFHPAQECC